MHHHPHHHHCPPAHHCHHKPCSPQPDPPFAPQQGLWSPGFWPAFSPSPLPRSCSSSSSSSSGNTDVSCTVHVDVPSTAAAPLLEPKPGDDGAAPTPLPAILFGVVFWAIFAWIIYSYCF